MKTETVGQLPPLDAQRDAIHVAIIPLVAGESDLRPGTRITINAYGEIVSDDRKSIGVVDPFLHPTTVIPKGTLTWVLLHPGTITGLRHDWSHPALDRTYLSRADTDTLGGGHDYTSPRGPGATALAEINARIPPPEDSHDAECREQGCNQSHPAVVAAINLIAEMAEERGLLYSELIDMAKEFAETGEYYTEGGRWEGHGVGDTFWDAFTVVTGREVPDAKRGGVFSCSC